MNDWKDQSYLDRIWLLEIHYNSILARLLETGKSTEMHNIDYNYAKEMFEWIQSKRNCVMSEKNFLREQYREWNRLRTQQELWNIEHST